MLKIVVFCWIVTLVALVDAVKTFVEVRAGERPLRWLYVVLSILSGVCLGGSLLVTVFFMEVGD